MPHEIITIKNPHELHEGLVFIFLREVWFPVYFFYQGQEAALAVHCDS